MTPLATWLLLLRRFSWRHWRETPGQTLLLIVILALGVAVFFSIRLANRAAVASFQHFTDLVTAENDWVLQAPAGDLPVALLPTLRQRLGAEPVHLIPVLESTATRPPGPAMDAIGSRETFRLLGVDLIGIQNPSREAARAAGSWFGAERDRAVGTRVGEGGTAEAGGVWKALRDGRSVFPSAALAARDRLEVGDGLPLVINEQIVTLHVAGILPELEGQPAAPPTLLVMDIPALQDLTGRSGRVTRIEVRVEPGPREAERREAVRTLLEQAAREPGPGSGWGVSSPSERRQAGAVMTRAFRLNLTILSLIALWVGLSLIVQALDGAVVRRRLEIGVLRSLGVEERYIRGAWLVEAAVLGVLGGLVGVVLGWGGAQLAVRWVGRTVNTLYYATGTQSAALSLGEVAAALGLSVAASLAAGWWPARAAARIPPAQVLVRHGAGAPAGWVFRHPGFGLALLAAGVVLAQLPPLRWSGGVRFPLGGYGAALLWIAGSSLLGGRVLAWTAAGVRRLGGTLAILRLASSQVRTPSSRHVLATASVVCAVAMTAGMGILVGSFERTMEGWITRTFQADLYVSSAGAQSASTDNRMSPDCWRTLVADPEVAEANVLHAGEIQLPGGTTILAGGDLGFMRRHTDLAWVEAPLGADGEFDRESGPPGGPAGALASESGAERFRWRRGDVLEIPTPAGPKRVRLLGIFADYGNERGSLVIDRRQFTDWFQTDHASSVMVRLNDPGSADAVRARWLEAFPGLQVFTQGHLRGEVLRIFRQTFAITYALEIIGLAVAVLGLAMSLASIVLERRAEWDTLRALGMRTGELSAMTAAEGAMVAGGGLLTGLAVSLALGWLLIRVINKQTFGWTLQMAIPVLPLVFLALLVLAAALGVGWFTGRWGGRLPAEQEE